MAVVLSVAVTVAVLVAVGVAVSCAVGLGLAEAVAVALRVATSVAVAEGGSAVVVLETATVGTTVVDDVGSWVGAVVGQLVAVGVGGAAAWVAVATTGTGVAPRAILAGGRRDMTTDRQMRALSHLFTANLLVGNLKGNRGRERDGKGKRFQPVLGASVAGRKVVRLWLHVFPAETVLWPGVWSPVRNTNSASSFCQDL
ncbi:MAG: hypothetical protein M1358_17585 [Chloroflexi bacterium]|nr:hypothetical protein [Chloroflexota bacterium]